MADLKPQVRELATAIEAKKAEAAAKFTEFDALRKSAVAEGVDFSKNADAFEKIDSASKSYDTVREEIAGMEYRRARLLEMEGGKSFDAAESKKEEAKSFGESFTSSEGYAQAKARLAQGGNIPLGTTESTKVATRGETKTLLTTSGSGTPLHDRQSFIVGKPLAGLSFLDVIATGTTDSDVVEWYEETTYTNNAAETAQGSDAVDSALALTLRTSNVREITHFLPVTRRAMSDQAFVESWINGRLVDGVKRRLLTQVLNGGGTGEDLAGIYGNSGIGSVDRSSTSTTMLDSLAKCITTVRINAYKEPDFVGIHPSDWETIRTSKASTAGGYLFGDPSVFGPRTIWGVPAIVDAQFTSGSPLVGVGNDAQLFIKEGVSVAASDSHSDYFIKRQVALLASMRVAFAVLQAKSFAISVA
ncbi:major_cap_HK97, phage major capsid protein, HK97 family [uncultured Caudovirales phage]|uniref:Major_cap_HK97, phage major capsid protein, HK97 family n=1 Tax=uncultured Caudovirales phage TaxID=2100421 RepID=A0A6J5STP6_9CAUD|nr:major_cap_HK97, phage major capsid protein, HK97 family [uncultured Caudovirales phage]